MLLRILYAVILFSLIGCKDKIKEPETDKQPKTDQATIDKILKINPNQDIVLGNINAKVKVFEYFSYTCFHCANLHQKTINLVKENYIDKGKIAYIIRELPFYKQDFEAAILARCAPKTQYHNFVNTLFAEQDNWAYTKNYKNILIHIGELGGVSSEEFGKCLEDRDIHNLILQHTKEAQLLNIHATPTLYINEKLYTGGYEYKEFSKALDEALNE